MDGVLVRLSGCNGLCGTCAHARTPAGVRINHDVVGAGGLFLGQPLGGLLFSRGFDALAVLAPWRFPKRTSLPACPGKQRSHMCSSRATPSHQTLCLLLPPSLCLSLSVCVSLSASLCLCLPFTHSVLSLFRRCVCPFIFPSLPHPCPPVLVPFLSLSRHFPVIFPSLSRHFPVIVPSSSSFLTPRSSPPTSRRT